MFSGVGKTPEVAKDDMLFQMSFFKDTAIEKGFSYPAFLDEEFEVVYKFDTESLLKPRKKQVEKIEKALHALGSELISIAL